MATFHLSCQVIKRSSGRSAVAAAAYRSGQRLIDEQQGRTWFYPRKVQIAHTEIMAPLGAPVWVFDRERLWNAVEDSEKRKDAQLAREMNIALPKELSHKQQLQLVRRFLQENCVDRGMVADFAIHRDDPNNPHFHVMLTMRALEKNRFGPKDRNWNRKEILVAWRQQWGESCNRELQRAGLTSRVTHLSHLARGLLSLPSIHMGLIALKTSVSRRCFVLDRVQEDMARREKNAKAILKDASIPLKELTYHEAVFTRADLEGFLKRNVPESEAQACFNAVMALRDVQRAGVNSQDKEVFTTTEVLQQERAMLKVAGFLAQTDNQAQVALKTVQAFGQHMGLSDEQNTALQHVVRQTGQLAFVEGHAGTGKSRMFDSARFLWDKTGYRVLGAALAGKAAEELGRSAGLKDSRSLAAWEYAWDHGRHTLTSKDVLVIDEAGMVGTRQMLRVLERVAEAGAKVVLAGDAAQLQAVEAGSPFRAIGELMESKAALSHIRRQTEAWQRQASTDLAKGAVSKALSAYASHGHVHMQNETLDKTVEQIAQAWMDHEASKSPKTQIIISYRRDDVDGLNKKIQACRLAVEKVRHCRELAIEEGKQAFGVGDRICFTRNDRQMGIRNGTLGTLVRFEGNQVHVQLDDDETKTVNFEAGTWKHFKLGYALTVHKSQGITVDRTHLLASKAFDRHAAYVGMTRHRERLDIYADKSQFRDGSSLAYRFARARHKSLALDYMTASALRPQMPAPLTDAQVAKTLHDARDKAVRAELDASRALAAAQKLAAEPLMTRTQAIDTVDTAARARRHLKDAAQARAFWRQQQERAPKTTWLQRLGLASPPVADDPISGIPLTLEVGLKKAETRVEHATRALELAQRSAEAQAEAASKMRLHNDPILKARGQVAQLAKKAAAAKRAQLELRRAVLNSPEIEREDGKRRALQKEQEREFDGPAW